MSVISLCSCAFVIVVFADWSVAVVAELISVLDGSTSQSEEEAQCSGFPFVMTASCVEGAWSSVISWAESEREMRSSVKNTAARRYSTTHITAACDMEMTDNVSVGVLISCHVFLQCQFQLVRVNTILVYSPLTFTETSNF